MLLRQPTDRSVSTRAIRPVYVDRRPYTENWNSIGGL